MLACIVYNRWYNADVHFDERFCVIVLPKGNRMRSARGCSPPIILDPKP